jgi:hypothetical protein
MDPYRPFSIMGWFLIIMGILFVALPYFARILPNPSKIPWYLLWVYRNNGFTFATSPILILISILSIIWHMVRT